MASRLITDPDQMTLVESEQYRKEIRGVIDKFFGEPKEDVMAKNIKELVLIDDDITLILEALYQYEQSSLNRVKQQDAALELIDDVKAQGDV